MEIRYLSRAEQDLDSFNKDVAEAIKEKARELRSRPADHDDVKIIRVDEDWFWRLKVGGRNRG